MGFFGVLGFVVDEVFYWGQDRILQVEVVFGGRDPNPVPVFVHEGEIVFIDLWFDYSSPFAYLVVSRVEGLFGDVLTWRSMLFGVVFKMVDAFNVFFFAMNEAKQNWMGEDMWR